MPSQHNFRPGDASASGPAGRAGAPVVLGIETSCDETAVALVTRDAAGAPQTLASLVLGQEDAHRAFGGVVPEIAARAHLGALDHLIEAALSKAGRRLAEVDAVAATAGPGLVGGLIVGLMTAKAIAAALGKPLIGVNHLEGHALTPRLTAGLDYPYLALLVSGGHTQMLAVRGLDAIERWGSTLDDAAGEAFDKTAKLLGLGFPGGPAVERAARGGNPARFALPQPLAGQRTLNFSFSGLKTAVRQAAQAAAPLSPADVADLCAAFQQTVSDSLATRARRAMARFGTRSTLVAVGGVAANGAIRQALEAACRDAGWAFHAPPLALCGDNAAMIAWAGLERFEAGLTSPLDIAPRSRWPLDESAAPVVGSGRRGAKA